MGWGVAIGCCTGGMGVPLAGVVPVVVGVPGGVAVGRLSFCQLATRLELPGMASCLPTKPTVSMSALPLVFASPW